MKASRFFHIFFFGFVAGIFVSSFFKINNIYSLFVFLIGVICFISGLFFKYIYPNNTEYVQIKQNFLYISLIIVSIFLGILRFNLSQNNFALNFVDLNEGKMLNIEGIVVFEPDVRENHTNLVIEHKQGLDKHKIRFLVKVSRYSDFDYGDRVTVSGRLVRPVNFQSENGRIFNYADYLAKDGVYGEIKNPNVVLVSKNNGSFVFVSLYKVKEIFITSLKKAIPEPGASLLSGLLVGEKQSLGKKLIEDFRRSGIVHIVVLSGYNITIVADFIMRIFSFLPKLGYLSLGSGSIILFAILTGGSATVVRASIMALIVILAKVTYRTYVVTRALLIAGFLMLIHNPRILVFDPSFQLSFLATLGLLYVSPIIQNRFNLIPNIFKFREIAIATFSTQIFVLPYLVYQMGQLSLVSLPVNLLILPIIPFTMFFGFLSGLLGLLNYYLSLPFAFISHLALLYELKIVDIFSSLPFASVDIKEFPISVTIFMYSILLFLIFTQRFNKNK